MCVNRKVTVAYLIKGQETVACKDIEDQLPMSHVHPPSHCYNLKNKILVSSSTSSGSGKKAGGRQGEEGWAAGPWQGGRG